MRVLVTGASGFVGKPLCLELLKEGHSVLGSYRSSNQFFQNINYFKIDDVNGSTDWGEVLNNVDVIVHLAARVHVMNDSSINPIDAFRKVNVDGTINLAKQASTFGVKRFVYLSSVKVNGEFTTFDHPFNEKMHPQPQDPYGVSKCEAEQLLMNMSKSMEMEVVVIRPPLVYGEGVKANFAKMLQALHDQKILPFGAIKNKRSFIYVGNLIDFIIQSISHPKAANQVFLVSDSHDLSTAELLQSCADAMGVKAKILSLPKWFIEFFAIVIGRKASAQRLTSSLQVDISKAQNLLDWHPRFSITQGLNATVIDWLKNQKNLHIF